MLTTPHLKNISCYEPFTKYALNLEYTLELTRYKLDLVGMQKVRWKKGGTLRAGNYNFLYRKGN